MAGHALHQFYNVTRRKPGETYLWNTHVSPGKSDIFELEIQRLSGEQELRCDFH